MTKGSAVKASRAASERSRRSDVLARRLGYEFRDSSLLRQALIHRSYLNENPGEALESNERLEFLGDSVLGSIVSRHLYDHYPNASEGWLTEVRSRLVRNETLGELARAQDVGRYLVMGRGVEAQHGRERQAILGRAWEALIGAVYLDGGIRSAQRFILRSLAGELETIAVAGLERDPKSMLQEACQAHWQTAPRYFTVDQRGPAHDRDFRVEVRLNGDVLGSGEGKSKQSAEKAAADAALRALPEEAIP